MRIVIGIKRFLKSAYFKYTAIFFVVVATFFVILRFDKTVMIGKNDEAVQHYPTYGYLSEYYREAISNPLDIKQVDFSVGQGFDVLTTLNYYGLGDPFSLLMVFFRNHITIGNVLINVLRLYVVGIVMIYFLKHWKEEEEKNQSLLALGGLAYAFSGFALISFSSHSYFNNALIFLPLFILGIKKCLREKKFLLLSFATALMFISNFYFAYMISLFGVIYVVIESVFDIVREKKKISEVFRNDLRVLLFVLLGIGMAAVVLLPIVIAVVNSARGGFPAGQNLLFFDGAYYENILRNFFVMFERAKNWTVLIVGIPGILAMIYAVLNRKKDLRPIVYLGLCIIGVLIPIFGKIFNGFSYVSNRWTFVIAFLTVVLFYEFLVWKKRKKIFNIAIMLIVILCGFNTFMVSKVDFLERKDILNGVKTSASEDGELYRTKKSGIANSALLTGERNLDFYYSLVPKEVTEFHKLVGNGDLKLEHQTYGIDERAVLKTLFAVKDKEADGGFARIYDKEISREEFEELDVVSRSKVLEGAVVVEKESGVLEYDKKCLDEIQELELFDFEMNKNEVNFWFNGKGESETYIVIRDLKLDADVLESEIRVISGGFQKSYMVQGEKSNFYFEKGDIIINLGRLRDGEEKRVEISSTGDLDISKENIKVFSNSMTKFDEKMETTKVEIDEYQEKNNEIKMKAKARSGVLQFSIPFSKGWKVFVDGEEKEVLKTDVMFLGVKWEGGEHEVTLKYETPMLKIGMAVSGVCVVIVGAIAICKKKAA